MTGGIPVFRLQLAIDGENIASVALPQVGQALTDLREFWIRYIAPKLYRDIQDNFDARGALADPARVQWAPLSPAYAKWKEKHFPGKAIMQRTDKLRQSLTFNGKTPGPEGLFEASRESIVFGTRVAYARHHQRPTGNRPPRRRILFLMKGASETFGRLLHAYSIDQMKAAGLRTRAAIIAKGQPDVPVVGGPGGRSL